MKIIIMTDTGEVTDTFLVTPKESNAVKVLLDRL